jgi:hypothetical protein
VSEWIKLAFVYNPDCRQAVGDLRVCLRAGRKYVAYDAATDTMVPFTAPGEEAMTHPGIHPGWPQRFVCRHCGKDQAVSLTTWQDWLFGGPAMFCNFECCADFREAHPECQQTHSLKHPGADQPVVIE